jgi:hypothetical protein
MWLTSNKILNLKDPMQLIVFLLTSAAHISLPQVVWTLQTTPPNGLQLSIGHWAYL